MKINKLLYVAMASVLLAGCGDDWNEDKLDGFGKFEVTDVKSLDITLTDADYKTVASNATNKALAEAEGLSSALSKLTSDKYFTSEIPASRYVPAFLAETYPTADDKSSVRVTYNQLVDEPAYLAPFANALSYQLTEEDYASVWGDKVQASFLSPKTEGRIAALLKNAFPAAQSGDIVMVDYAYSDVEPSIGGGEVEETFDNVSDALSTVGEYNVKGTVVATNARGFLLQDATGTILVYLNAMPNVSLGDVVTVQGNTSTYANLMQFGNTAVVTRLESSASFAYPAPKVMSGAELDAYVANVTGIQYAEITGKLIVSGNYLNLEVDGATKQGSIQYPAPSVVDADLNGKQVVVTGYLIGASSRYNVMATSVVAADGSSPVYTPIGVVALSAEGAYDVKGQVVATYGRGFLLSDATGKILVFDRNGYDFVPGDIVTVSGTTSLYEGLMQFSSPECEKVGNATLATPAAMALTATEMDAYLNDPYVAYVAYTGTLEVSGNYLNVTIEGAETAIGSLSYVTGDMLDAVKTLDGKKILVEGYSIGTSSGKYFNTMAVNVTEVSAASLPARLAAVTRAIVAPNKAAVYEFGGTSWTEATVDGATIAVMQPADYASIGTSYVGNPAQVLPIYASQHYPYAQADDKLVVVYVAASDGSVAAKELVYDGTGWVLTTNVTTVTDQFVRASGKWNYDPSVTIELPSGKNQPLSTLYFQTATDWVWENIDVPLGFTTKGQGYVTSYENNEYYCGCSAYQGNVDWRASAAKTQYPAEYSGKEDTEIVALMQERFVTVMQNTLATIHPQAAPVEGVTVTYTVNFVVYTGSSSNWTIQYVVTAPGVFEYVQDSLHQVD